MSKYYGRTKTRVTVPQITIKLDKMYEIRVFRLWVTDQTGISERTTYSLQMFPTVVFTKLHSHQHCEFELLHRLGSTNW